MATTSYTDPTTAWAAYALQDRTDESGSAVDDLNGEDMRIVLEAFTAGVLSANAFQVREGSPTPGMTVRVGSGAAKSDVAILEGTEAGQGKYMVRLGDGVTDVTVPAADVSNPRIDEVYLVVQDDPYDSNGANTVPRIGYRQGDAASNPSAPGPDGSWTAYLKLASIDVGAGVTEIEDADITDERQIVELADDIVATDSIRTAAVTTAKLADGAVTNTKIGTDAVTAAKIADGAVVATRIAGDAVSAFLVVGSGVDDSGPSPLTGSFVDKASVTFNRPAGWSTYKILAWGSVTGYNDAVATSVDILARVEIGGNNGPSATGRGNVAGSERHSITAAASHDVAGLSASSLTIAVAAREAGQEAMYMSSTVSYIAIRTS